MRVRIICNGDFRVRFDDGCETVFEAEAKGFDYELDQEMTEAELRTVYEGLKQAISQLMNPPAQVCSEDPTDEFIH